MGPVGPPGHLVLDKVPEALLKYVKLISITPLFAPLFPFPELIRTTGFKARIPMREGVVASGVD